MTDRPVTIHPPADIDREKETREKETEPPSQSDFPPPEFVTLADRHAQRLTAIEAHLANIRAALVEMSTRMQKVDQLYELAMRPAGRPARPKLSLGHGPRPTKLTMVPRRRKKKKDPRHE